MDTSVKHCDEKLKLAKEILKDQIITTEKSEFALKSATSKDIKHNVFFRDQDSYPDCGFIEWKKKLMPCKHMFSLMENNSGINRDSFSPQYKNSVTLRSILKLLE